MVRTIAAALLCGGCTLIVDHQLSQNPGGCGELIFLDGTPNNGGQYFHSGVTAPTFRGAAFPPASKTPDNFGATLAFLSGAGLEFAGGLTGDTVYLRPEPNYTATSMSPTPGHEGPGGFGCAEAVAATYDSLRDRTSLQLIAGGCGDDLAYDGGTFSGAPAALAPAVAWAALPDGGGIVAAVVGSQGEACAETFPLTCFPPQGGAVAGGGERRVDSLTDAQGQPIWMVSTAGADVRLYSADFASSTAVVGWSGPIAALAADVGAALRINAGHLQAQIFDVTGAARGAQFDADLGDAAAHGLEIARFGTTPVLRAAWIGGDGRARIATFDATVAASPQLATPALVCGSQGASFVAPLSSTTAAVLLGDALYLRHVD